jgi:type IV secretion system protein VirD4
MKILALLVIVLVIVLALAFLRWAIVPRRHVPRFRVATMRLRLRLRLHPGRGFMTLPGLWLHWSRSAALRGSARVRPGLSLWQRIRRPASHSVCLGRAQYRHRLWQTIQENILIIGRSRSGKSGWLAEVIVRFHGAVVSATTKPDLFVLTSWLRSLRGRPVFTFDPQHIGGPRTTSTIRYDPVPGCEVPAVAMRRGTALTDAIRTKGTEGDGFWSEQAATQMPALLAAAALRGLDLRSVRRWTLSGDTRDPERYLRAGGRPDWADSLAQMRGPAEKTGATVRMVLNSSTKFMDDPAIAECVLPAPGAGFDIPEFLRQQGSLYLIADQRSEISPLAPLFACLVAEIHWTACQIAGSTSRERLDPPLLLLLDECTRICPIPAPALLADSGGRGIMMILAAQGLAQIEERWGKTASRSVLDTSNQIYVAGIHDPDTLAMASDLCDVATYQMRGGEDKTADYPVATKAMISRLPKKRALVLRGGMPAPVITHLPMIWHDWRYRWARLRRRGVATLTPAPALAQHSAAAAVRAARPVAWTAVDAVAADRVLAAALAGGPDATAGRAVNGNGHHNGSQNGHATGHGAAAGTSYPWDKK